MNGTCKLCPPQNLDHLDNLTLHNPHGCLSTHLWVSILDSPQLMPITPSSATCTLRQSSMACWKTDHLSRWFSYEPLIYRGFSNLPCLMTPEGIPGYQVTKIPNHRFSRWVCRCRSSPVQSDPSQSSPRTSLKRVEEFLKNFVEILWC